MVSNFKDWSCLLLVSFLLDVAKGLTKGAKERRVHWGSQFDNTALPSSLWHQELREVVTLYQEIQSNAWWYLAFFLHFIWFRPSAWLPFFPYEVLLFRYVLRVSFNVLQLCWILVPPDILFCGEEKHPELPRWRCLKRTPKKLGTAASGISTPANSVRSYLECELGRLSQ